MALTEVTYMYVYQDFIKCHKFVNMFINPAYSS